MRTLAAILAAGGVALAAAVSTDAAPTRSQQFFAELILEDKRTSPAIRALLRSGGGGFVDRGVVFRDLTGDDRDDAVVRVQSGGAAGAVAVYIFSTTGGRRLRPLFRRERLRRASTRISGGKLTIRSARYAAGDELCCPSATDVRHVTWDRETKRFVVTMPSGQAARGGA